MTATIAGDPSAWKNTMQATPNRLLPSHRERLKVAERVIDEGLGIVWQKGRQVGNALSEIRDDRLYRETHANFDDYSRARWGMSRSAADRLINFARALAELTPIGGILPENEAQARPLTKLESLEDRLNAWEEIVATAPEGQVTADHSKAVVEQRKADGLPTFLNTNGQETLYQAADGSRYLVRVGNYEEKFPLPADFDEVAWRMGKRLLPEPEPQAENATDTLSDGSVQFVTGDQMTALIASSSGGLLPQGRCLPPVLVGDALYVAIWRKISDTGERRARCVRLRLFDELIEECSEAETLPKFLFAEAWKAEVESGKRHRDDFTNLKIRPGGGDLYVVMMGVTEFVALKDAPNSLNPLQSFFDPETETVRFPSPQEGENMEANARNTPDVKPERSLAVHIRASIYDQLLALSRALEGPDDMLLPSICMERLIERLMELLPLLTRMRDRQVERFRIPRGEEVDLLSFLRETVDIRAAQMELDIAPAEVV